MINWHATSHPHPKIPASSSQYQSKKTEHNDTRIKTPKHSEENHRIVGLIGK